MVKIAKLTIVVTFAFILCASCGRSNQNTIKGSGKLEFRLVDESIDVQKAIKGILPENIELLYDPNNKPFLVNKEVLLECEKLKSVELKLDNAALAEYYYIDLYFTEEDAVKIGNLTEKYSKKKLAIVVNGKLISTPVIEQRLKGDKAIIIGDYSKAEWNKIIKLFKTVNLSR